MKSNQTAQQSGEAFRRRLQEELARRCARNSQYSLRAFARDLETDHSTLSQILRGRRPLTERTIRTLGAVLELAPDEVERHVLRELRHAPVERTNGAVRVLRELTEDTLAVISGFEHYAILELTHVDDFRPDVRWIARVLELSPDAVNVAIGRLLRLGLLRMADPKTWVDCTGDLTHLLDGIAYEAVWNLSARARKHAIRAGLATPGRLRDFSSTTLAVDQSRLPEALKILTRARNEALRVLSEGERRDHVYHLDISLIPLTSETQPDEEEASDE